MQARLLLELTLVVPKEHLREVGFLLIEVHELQHPNFRDLALMYELLLLLHSGSGSALVPSSGFRGIFPVRNSNCKKSLVQQLVMGFRVQLVHLKLLHDV